MKIDSVSLLNNCFIDIEQNVSSVWCLQVGVVDELIQTCRWTDCEVGVQLLVGCWCSGNSEVGSCRSGIGYDSLRFCWTLSLYLCDVLLRLGWDDTYFGSNLSCCLLFLLCFSLLPWDLCINQRGFYLVLILDVDDLQVFTCCESCLPELFVYCLPHGLGRSGSIIVESFSIELTNFGSHFKISPGDKLFFIVLLMFVVKSSDVLLNELVLNGNWEGDILATTILALLEGLSLRSLVITPVNIDHGCWEGQEWSEWSDHVPSTPVYLILVDFLRYRVVLNTIFDWLNCSNTHQQNNKTN
jgi:hypothetical protein